MREALCAAAVRAAQSVGYVGAGTVEFIVDASRGLRSDAFWFMEMNTRLQVEHAVTEAVVGRDLVELQFRVAAGEALGFTQEDVTLEGHAIEARLCAEDPRRDFLPSTGRVLALHWPEGDGLRLETGIEEGVEVSPFYDSLLAKLVAAAPTREEALAKLQAALAATRIMGPLCNLSLLADALATREFRTGKFDTRLVETIAAADERRAGFDPEAAAVGLCDLLDQARAGGATDPWSVADAFQFGPQRRSFIEVEADGKRLEAYWSLDGSDYRIEIPELGFDARMSGGARQFHVVAEPRRRLLWRDLRQTEVRLCDQHTNADRFRQDGERVVASPMPGRVARLFVEVGSQVERGDPVVMVEAMKMEHALHAPHAGRVVAVHVREGDRVALGAPLVEIGAGATS
jgi:3-methylcrotonyl-CoA carboxylase alpha subunit